MDDRTRSEQLTDDGYRLLDEGNAEAALDIAAQLEGLQFTSAFEIGALAHAQLDDLDAAVALLERGVKLAPDVWLNWQLLGNFLSDLDRFDEAMAAYEQALSCPDVDESSVRLNQAILAARRELDEQALSFAELVTDPALAINIAPVYVDALSRLGRVEEAIERGEAARANANPDQGEELGYLAAAIERARWEQGRDAQEVAAAALAALEQYDRLNPALLTLIRNADNAYSKDAQYQRLSIDAKVPSIEADGRASAGYIINYDVVADSREEALTFVERMEGPPAQGNLVIDEHEILEPRPDDPKGVYRRTVRHYYESAG